MFGVFTEQCVVTRTKMLTTLGFASVLKLYHVSVKLKSSYFIPERRNEVCKYILDDEVWKGSKSTKKEKDFSADFFFHLFLLVGG